MAGIFDRQRLSPQQMRTVADRRLADAEYLRRSNRNVHANGAMYLGGFTLECLLKARLLEAYPWLQRSGVDPASRPKRERRLFDLCYRQHDLASLVEALPSLPAELLEIDNSGALLRRLRELCGTWSIYARYSTHQADIRQAGDFLDNIKEVRRWLR